MAEIRVLDDAPDDSTHDTTHDAGCSCCQPPGPAPVDEEVRRLEALKAELDRRLSSLESP